VENSWRTERKPRAGMPTQKNGHRVKCPRCRANLRLVDEGVELDKEVVDGFLNGAEKKTSGFGTGRSESRWRSDVEEICFHYAKHCGVEDHGRQEKKHFVNEIFGLMQNLMIWGVPQKPKSPTARSSPTSKDKMIKIIDSMGKPRDPVAAIIHAVKRQPQYLP